MRSLSLGGHLGRKKEKGTEGNSIPLMIYHLRECPSADTYIYTYIHTYIRTYIHSSPTPSIDYTLERGWLRLAPKMQYIANWDGGMLVHAHHDHQTEWNEDTTYELGEGGEGRGGEGSEGIGREWGWKETL